MIRMPRAMFCWGLAIFAMIVSGARSVAEPPTGKEIAEVVIQGNRIRSTEQIRARMDTKPGLRYDQTVVQNDVNRLIKEGWFLPQSIQIKTIDRSDGKVTVVFSVIELPNVIKSITYRGADHLNKDDLEKMTGLKVGQPLNVTVVQAARNAIIRAYQEKGRLWATVKLIKGDKKDDNEVIFDIAEGPSVKVGSVKFEFFGTVSGDTTEGRLRTQLQTSNGKFGLGLVGAEFDKSKLDMDIVKLTEYYHNLGYLSARAQPELIWSDDHRTMTVVIHIDEGPRYKITKFQIDGNRTEKEDRLYMYSDTREGEFYDKLRSQADQKRIKDLYGFQGKPVVVRETIYQVGEGAVNVHYQVEEKEPVRALDVKIIGNKVTRDHIIRRQIDIYPGQILSYPDLQLAEQKLARLAIFEQDEQKGIKPTVQVENPEVDEPFKNILVRVQEKATGSFMVGAGINSSSGLTGNVVVNERNFDILNWPSSFDEILEGKAWRGAGQELRIQASPGTQFQQYSATFREPSLFDSRYSFSASIYYYERDYTQSGYQEERLGAKLTWGRALDQNFQIYFTERIESVNIDQIPDGAPPDITTYAGPNYIFGEKVGVIYDNRDSVLRPTSGEKADIGVEYVLGSYQFPIVSGDFTKFWTMYQRKDGSGRQVLAFKSSVAWEGGNAPIFERFYAGGYNSMRGFAFRGVGPYVDGYNVGGNFMWLNSLEYQIPLMANDNLYFVSFIDSGTVEQSMEIKDYRVSVGVGMRIAIPQLLGPVPLALDFGIPIVKGPEDNKQLFSFWLGFFN